MEKRQYCIAGEYFLFSIGLTEFHKSCTITRRIVQCVFVVSRLNQFFKYSVDFV